MKQHVAQTAAACFYHIRRSRQVRRPSGRPGSHTAAGRGTHNAQTGLLQQCAGGTATLEPLQRVQNAAARLVFSLGRLDHVTPSLIHGCQSARESSSLCGRRES